jgi:5'-deoxynucleotidase
MSSSKFIAYLERLRWIKRWGLKRNVVEENVPEHSWNTACIAHMLGLINNRYFGGQVNPQQIATVALYHDVSEIITGDMPSPIKYKSRVILDAYRTIEHEAEQEILSKLPAELQGDFAGLLISKNIDAVVHDFVKAADLISAYMKCRSEVAFGNKEFEDALKDVEKRIRELKMPEVHKFMTLFVDDYVLTLDQLLREHDPKA